MDRATGSIAERSATVVSSPSAAKATVEQDYVLPRGWYTLGAILAATLFAFVDRQLITLAAAPLAKSLHLSDSQLGMIQGLTFTVFTVVAVYPLAWAADRFDRRYVLGACIVLWSLGTAACGLAQNFTQLFLAVVAIAAGETGLAPITMSIIPDLFHGRKRVLANGINYFAAYLGIALALALGGLALGSLDAVHDRLPPPLAQWDSWRLAFFVVALPAPVMLALIAFARLDHRRNIVARSEAVPSGPSLLDHLREHRWAIGWMLSALCIYMLAFGGFLVWLPVVATRLFGTTAAQNGASMGLAMGIGMVGGVLISTLLVRRMISKIGQRASVRLCWVIMLVTTPVLVLIPLATSAWQLYFLFGGMMLSGTAIGVLVPTMLQTMAPGPVRARFMAIYTIVTSLIAGSAPTLVGYISDAIGGQKGLLYSLEAVALPAWIVATILFRVGERPFALLSEETVRIDAATARGATQAPAFA